MPTQPAQTIYELVQGRKNPLADSYNCFSSLGRSSAPQSVKSLSEVFPSLVISFTLYHKLVSFTFLLTALAESSKIKLITELNTPTAVEKLYWKFMRPILYT